mmetsp:Transcript_23503/g.32808  ORF Transcript_23503/g.32808 Transcript_23503/m.32808 type:complete len:137 (-) Transcript_23503:2607-3017(-)
MGSSASRVRASYAHRRHPWGSGWHEEKACDEAKRGPPRAEVQDVGRKVSAAEEKPAPVYRQRDFSSRAGLTIGTEEGIPFTVSLSLSLSLSLPPSLSLSISFQRPLLKLFLVQDPSPRSIHLLSFLLSLVTSFAKI